MQRKTFRIEQMAVGGRDSAPRPQTVQASASAVFGDAASAAEHELVALQEAIATNKRELSGLISDGNERRMGRAAGELGAAVESMETATQNILASAEVIDDCARALASALTNDYHHGLAQDVQDHVVRVYEACNFQDLAGQRIGKVIATLIALEERISAMLARYRNCKTDETATPSNGSSAATLINGPRLDGDSGHVSQHDIDAMFA